MKAILYGSCLEEGWGHSLGKGMSRGCLKGLPTIFWCPERLRQGDGLSGGKDSHLLCQSPSGPLQPKCDFFLYGVADALEYNFVKNSELGTKSKNPRKDEERHRSGIARDSYSKSPDLLTKARAWSVKCWMLKRAWASEANVSGSDLIFCHLPAVWCRVGISEAWFLLQFIGENNVRRAGYLWEFN